MIFYNGSVPGSKTEKLTLSRGHTYDSEIGQDRSFLADSIIENDKISTIETRKRRDVTTVLVGAEST